MPRNLDELRHHTVIGFDTPPAWLPRLKGLPFQLTRAHFAIRCDDDRAQLAALRAGVGICACQHGIARRDTELVPAEFTFSKAISRYYFAAKQLFCLRPEGCQERTAGFRT
jgi:hypothetical protein